MIKFELCSVIRPAYKMIGAESLYLNIAQIIPKPKNKTAHSGGFLPSPEGEGGPLCIAEWWMRCCLGFPQKSVDGSYKNILIILLKDKRIIKFSINTSSVSRCEPPSPSGEGEEVASLPVSGRLSICLPFKSSSPLNKNLPTENF